MRKDQVDEDETAAVIKVLVTLGACVNYAPRDCHSSFVLILGLPQGETRWRLWLGRRIVSKLRRLNQTQPMPMTLTKRDVMFSRQG